MANVIVTRTDGSTETIVLTDKKEDGHEYMSFKCSDGVTRYALLGESTDSKASHLWFEKDGVKKYCLKDPTTGLPFDVKLISEIAPSVRWEFIEVSNLFKFAPMQNIRSTGDNRYYLYVKKLSGLPSEVQSVTLSLTVNRVKYENGVVEDDLYMSVHDVTVSLSPDREWGMCNLSSNQAAQLCISDDYVGEEGAELQGTYTYTLS